VTVNLWVDDVKDPTLLAQYLLGENEPTVWVWARTAASARMVLFSPGTRIAHLALDNDMGEGALNDGRAIAHEILQRVLDDETYDPPMYMHCISGNPIAAREIEATFNDIAKVRMTR